MGNGEVHCRNPVFVYVCTTLVIDDPCTCKTKNPNRIHFSGNTHITLPSLQYNHSNISNHAQELLHRVQCRSIVGAPGPVLRCLPVRHGCIVPRLVRRLIGGRGTSKSASFSTWGMEACRCGVRAVLFTNSCSCQVNS
jgi:hypothetical protein